jgi:predicted transcriptional regulator
MSSPARTILPGRPLTEAAKIMLDENVNRLPVVDANGFLVGLVSRGDLIRAFARPDAEIRREIQEDVVHGAMWIDPEALDVTVTSGIVTLTGEVASEADAELLPTFARKVPGVVDVRSALTYRS